MPRVARSVARVPERAGALVRRRAVARRGCGPRSSRVHGSLGLTYPLVIGGERILGPGTIPSVNPARPGEVVGDVVAATPQDVHDALDVATAAFATWSRVPVGERADLLFRAAAALRERNDWYDALMVYEVGKTWVEADADTAEAIDFLEFYGREALRLADPAGARAEPVERRQRAALRAARGGGDHPALELRAGDHGRHDLGGGRHREHRRAQALARRRRASRRSSSTCCTSSGCRRGSSTSCPGDALTVGETLVADRRTRFISFTGSKAVGLHINQVAAVPAPGQRWIKRVIAELGGKDAIVVAGDADLDAAVEGVVASAFGFAGQKCSACSRAIVEASVYDRFVEQAGRADGPAAGRGPGRSGRGRRPGDQRARRRANTRLHRGRARRRSPRGRRRAGAGRWLLHRADGFRRCRPGRADRPRGDLRAGPGCDPGAGLRRRAGDRQRDGLRADRGGLYPQSDS